MLELINRFFVDRDEELFSLEVCADHAHILFEAPPTESLSGLANALKTMTARIIRKEFAGYLSQFCWKPLFWECALFKNHTHDHLHIKSDSKFEMEGEDEFHTVNTRLIKEELIMKNATWRPGMDAWMVTIPSYFKKTPTIRKVTVKKVGSKYVTINEAYEKQFSFTQPSDLKEFGLVPKEYECNDVILCASEDAARKCMEKAYLMRWFSRKSSFSSYSHGQLMEAYRILEGSSEDQIYNCPTYEENA